MLPVLVTTRVGEFHLFHRWWEEGHRFGLITVPHKKVPQFLKRAANVPALNSPFNSPLL